MWITDLLNNNIFNILNIRFLVTCLLMYLYWKKKGKRKERNKAHPGSFN